MIPEHIKILIEKYKNGFEGKPGVSPPVNANNIPDYESFVEYWLKKKREGTVRQYLSILHKWNKPINQENLSNWSKVFSLINDERHNYKPRVIRTKNKTYTYNRHHSYDNLSNDELVDNTNHFEYKLHRVIRLYLISINKSEWIDVMPRIEDVPKIKHNVKKGHFSEEEFLKFIEFIDDKQIKLMYLLMFYTGARIREVIQIKKNTEWFPSLKDGKIILLDGELFKTVIPKLFAKSKRDEESLYFIKKDIEKLLINFVNECKDNDYIFSIRKDTSRTRIYLDEQKIKNVFRKYLECTLITSGFSHFKGLLTPHSFRRGFVHYTYNLSGNDIVFTSKVTRHKSGVVMTDKYLQQDQKKIEDKILELRKNETREM